MTRHTHPNQLDSCGSTLLSWQINLRISARKLYEAEKELESLTPFRFNSLTPNQDFKERKQFLESQITELREQLCSTLGIA
jgi:hypothetical protein